ncbi:SAM-dependent methyltransferase [Actinomadura barringtoniae]|uniref:SAM-dependent methyltransferase n=1 Tax=Actinomadura barringtoniae TaxID=1427535 RepID=A0A939PHV5_9ACTN|nr:SAM-dependent methyltransferase [Actinomadura barringtoniae]MBO2448831.1 SAM-dependent methyltransferase [Actinomadura barringtoniae]
MSDQTSGSNDPGDGENVRDGGAQGGGEGDNTPELDLARLRVDVPHSARIYDYILGGKDNFEADRAAAAEIVKYQPTIPRSMRGNRAFMARMTRHLVTEFGITQFLDVGTGLPTSPNLHEAAQQVDPTCRILYVDNDPIVLVHARALLRSNPAGRTSYLDADLRDPAGILDSDQFHETLDLKRPIALTLIAIMQMFEDDEEAHGLVRRLVEPLAPGSTLSMTIVPDDPEVEAGSAIYRARGLPMRTRSKAEAERFFDGLELIDPGVTRSTHWHPEGVPETGENHMYAGVAIKR